MQTKRLIAVSIFDKENPHWAALKCETEEEYLILKKRIDEMSENDDE